MADGQQWLSAVFFSLYAKKRKVKGNLRKHLLLLAFRVIYRLPKEKGVAEFGDSDKGRKQQTEAKT